LATTTALERAIVPDQTVLELYNKMLTTYFIEERTVATSQPGHVLCVAGVLKQKTSIVPPDINIGYCRLEFRDAGPSRSDPFLRRCYCHHIAFPTPGVG